MKKLILGLACLSIKLLYPQSTFPTNGAPDPNHTTYAFVNAVIHVNEDITLKNGTLIVKDNKIVDAIENGVAEILSFVKVK